jgi:hypothetical protein
MTFRTAVKISWMYFYCEFYDWHQILEICLLYLVFILMYTDSFEPTVSEDNNRLASQTIIQTILSYTDSKQSVPGLNSAI